MVHLLLCVLLGASPAGAAAFPYPIAKRTLSNGLDVLVIPTPEFKGVVSYNTLVLAGSRDEAEPGKTGLAHLFEHILFRHRLDGRENGYTEAIDRLGADSNAWTWFDVTYFHALSLAADLPELARLEADRFARFDISEKTFKTEAGAVLGEFRRDASFPTMRLSERLAAVLFPGHGYGHTTIGSYEDVVDMPNEYAAARGFYEARYRPESCVLVVAGDVDPEDVFALAEKAYAGWKPGGPAAARPPAAFPAGPFREDLDWTVDVAPIIWAAWRTPAFVPGTPDAAVGRILDELLVSPASGPGRRLRGESRAVRAMDFADGTAGFESAESRAMTVTAQLYADRWESEGEDYLSRTADEIVAGVEALARFSERPAAAAELDILKSKKRYDHLAELTSPQRIAAVVAHHYRFGRDLTVFERMDAALAALRPADVDAFARRWLTPGNRAVFTLARRGAKK